MSWRCYGCWKARAKVVYCRFVGHRFWTAQVYVFSDGGRTYCLRCLARP